MVQSSQLFCINPLLLTLKNTILKWTTNTGPGRVDTVRPNC